MASEWYRAVCDKHKEACHVIVNDPHRTEWLLGKYSNDIKQWLNAHYGCELRLIHRDDQMEKLYDEKYILMDRAFQEDDNGKN
ncbi:MAG: hypothetical protein P4L79_10380 [Legionella sp.]|uniref:hypothetical protein n=1 Tax=Legionella sp. TaxID=459 RepID=UPI002851120B|nr:hypothetical protein [Legionella sp.]